LLKYSRVLSKDFLKYGIRVNSILPGNIMHQNSVWHKKFENEMERIFRNSKCISTSNGTISLQLAFQALGLKKGDEVVLPSYCYQAAGNVANMMGLKLVFSDVNFFSWNISLENIKKGR